MKKRIFKESGLSLVEVTMAGALLIGVGVAMTRMSLTTNQAIKNSEKNLDMVSLLSEIRGVLSDPDACKQTFENVDAENSDNTGAITEIKKENGSIVFQVGQKYGSAGLILESIKLNSTDPNVTVVPNNSNGSTNAILEFNRGNSVNTVKIITKRIRLNVNTQAGDDVVLVDSCNSFSTGESSVWTRNATDPDNIFYNSGNVGIGTDDPRVSLHVKGSEGLRVERDVEASYIQLVSNRSNPTGHVTSLIDFIGLNSAGARQRYAAIKATAVDYTAGSEDGYMTLSTRNAGSTNEVMRITNLGHIGIRNTNPTAYLEINGGANNTRAVQINTENSSLQLYEDSETPNIFRIRPGSGLGVAISGNNDSIGVFVKSDLTADVGIGTTTPQAKLEITKLPIEERALVINSGTTTLDFYEDTEHPNVFRIRPTRGLGVAISGNNDTIGMFVKSDSTANVGIGTTAPTHKLHVIGSAAKTSGTSWAVASDIRLKHIKEDYNYGLNEILQLNPIRYNYKDNKELNLSSKDEQVGFVAQDVQRIIPDAVSKRKDGYLEINADPIHWASINAIQELHKKIQNLKAENSKIKEDNEDMKEFLCSKYSDAPFCI